MTPLILEHRTILQRNLDVHKLVESQRNLTELTYAVATMPIAFLPSSFFGIGAVKVFMFVVPMVSTSDSDVAPNEAFARSDRLCSNALLDMLEPGQATYPPGLRQNLLLAAVLRVNWPLRNA